MLATHTSSDRAIRELSRTRRTRRMCTLCTSPGVGMGVADVLVTRFSLRQESYSDDRYLILRKRRAGGVHHAPLPTRTQRTRRTREGLSYIVRRSVPRPLHGKSSATSPPPNRARSTPSGPGRRYGGSRTQRRSIVFHRRPSHPRRRPTPP